MKNFKFAISIAMSAALAFPPSVFAATKSNAEAMKQNMKDLGMVSNKSRPTFQDVYLKLRPDLPKDIRVWMDETVAQWGQKTLPPMDTQVIKGKNGQDILRITLKDPSSKPVVVELDPTSEKTPLKLNGKALPAKAWGSEKEIMEFFDANSQNVNPTSAKNILPSHDLYVKMRPADRVMYFMNLRLTLEAAQKVMNGSQVKTSDNDTSKYFELIYKFLVGADAEAASTGAEVAVKIQTEACTQLRRAGKINEPLGRTCNGDETSRAGLLSQAPAADVRSAIQTARKNILEDTAVMATCKEAGANCNSINQARRYVGGNSSMKAAFDKKYVELARSTSTELNAMEGRQQGAIQAEQARIALVGKQTRAAETKQAALNARRAADRAEDARDRALANEAKALEQQTNAQAAAKRAQERETDRARDQKIKAACLELTKKSYQCTTATQSMWFLDAAPNGKALLAKHGVGTSEATQVRQASTTSSGAAAAGAPQVAASAQPVSRQVTNASTTPTPHKPDSSSTSSEPSTVVALETPVNNSITTASSNACMTAGYIGRLTGVGCEKTAPPQGLNLKNSNMLASFDGDCSGGDVSCNPLLYGFAGGGKAICVAKQNSTKSCDEKSPLVKDTASQDVARILSSLVEKNGRKADEFIKDGKLVSKEKYEELKTLVLSDMQAYINAALEKCQGSSDASCALLQQRNQHLVTGLNLLEQFSGNAGIAAAAPKAQTTGLDGSCTGPDGPIPCDKSPLEVDTSLNANVDLIDGPNGPTPDEVGPAQTEGKKKGFFGKAWGVGKWVLGGGLLIGLGILLFKGKNKKSSNSGQSLYQYENGTGNGGTIQNVPNTDAQSVQ